MSDETSFTNESETQNIDLEQLSQFMSEMRKRKCELLAEGAHEVIVELGEAYLRLRAENAALRAELLAANMTLEQGPFSAFAYMQETLRFQGHILEVHIDLLAEAKAELAQIKARRCEKYHCIGFDGIRCSAPVEALSAYPANKFNIGFGEDAEREGDPIRSGDDGE